MGLHDREYWQEDTPPGLRVTGGPRMIVTNLIIVTAAIALLDLFTPGSQWLSGLLALKADLYRRPWEVWNLLSYGFAHAPIAQKGGIWHVGMNMFMLWMFGRVIEKRLGRLEFLWFYLAAIVFSGLTWLGLENAWLVAHGREAVASVPAQVVGASGGVTAVFLLFVLYYPRETLYVWGLFAVPAWILGAVVIGLDLLNALTGQSGNVAWQAHIGGAAFAFLYLRNGWNFSRHLPSPDRWRWKWPAAGARLKLHHPDADPNVLDEEADRILEKLHREGERSLSGRERRILEKYSRRMREKRRP
ncbi:MAG: rhomboid family intramembrane serine protease [Pirellulaceae bacterium]